MPDIPMHPNPIVVFVMAPVIAGDRASAVFARIGDRAEPAGPA
jgi:hypothetical protein